MNLQSSMTQINATLVKMYQQIRIDAGPEDFNKMTETQKQRLKNQEAMIDYTAPYGSSYNTLPPDGRSGITI